MYITPRVLIKQEFTQLPVYSEFPLPAFVFGPQYALTRYSEASEKPFTALATYGGNAVGTGNSYVPSVDTSYDFPNVPAGGAVDGSYTKVYAESVQAQYFPLAALGDAGVGGDSVSFVTAPSGSNYPNRVRFTGVTLKTANGVSRSAVFSNRDVAVGDIVEVTDNLGNYVKANIKALIAVDPTIDSALAAAVAPIKASGADGVVSGGSLSVFTSASATFTSALIGQYLTLTSGNITRKILSVTNGTTLVVDSPFSGALATQAYRVGGTYNDLGNVPTTTTVINATPTYVAASGSSSGVTIANSTTVYKGYAASRVLSDVYTVTVTAGTNLATAQFSIASQNGVFATKTGVSLASAVLVVDSANGNDVRLNFTGTTAFVVGSQWTVAVTAGVAAVNPTTSGTYVGANDMVYRLYVERGGAFYDGTNSATCARLLISSSDVDNSTLVLPQAATAFNVGSYGARATFATGSNNSGLIFGDTYYVPVTAAKSGAVTIVELSENLPTNMLALSATRTAKLSLAQSSVRINEIRDLLADTRNWTQSGNYITIKAGLTTTDASLVSAGSPAALTVTAAKLFVEHRDLLQDNVVAIGNIRSTGDVITTLGPIHPDNPLAAGVYEALLNAQGQVVYYMGVPTDDLAGYLTVVKAAEKSDKVYSFAPLTFDRTIQDAIVGHVNAYSTPEVGRWRICWLSVQDNKTALLIDKKTNGSAYQGTVTDDPTVAGTQNRVLTVEGGNFLTLGVRPNDTVRINFRLSSSGVLTYDEYVVDQVRTNTTLTFTTNLVAAINSPVKIQVVRNYTKSERAANIAAIGGDFNNRRVRVVFPDTYRYGGVTKPGYLAAAGLAGLRSGVVPHQGLTNSEYLGADDLSKTVSEFSQDDLNTMAEAGIWILTQEVVGATPYVRHALTTDTSGLNTSEDMITTNVDSISYGCKRAMAPFIGRWNINPESVKVAKAALVAELQYRATETYTVRAGNQLTSFSPKDDILEFAQSATYADRMVSRVKLNLPAPFNYLELTLLA